MNKLLHIFNVPSHYRKVREFYNRYERFLLPAFLVSGFLFDYLVFITIQNWVNLIFLLAYWVIAGIAIAVGILYDSGRLSLLQKYGKLVAVLLTQFTFGNMLSGCLVFYWFSGAFSISWPFIVVLALLMVFFDVFRHYFLKPIFQLSLYFFITLSLSALALPIIFSSISPWVFIVAIVLALVIFIFYVRLLSYLSPVIKEQRIFIFLCMGVIFALMNALYFANIIPPIPLSIREAGIYHSIKSSKGVYTMGAEPQSFWQGLVPGETIHLVPGKPLYIYSAIYAPVKLTTTIIHHWQYYDEASKEWIDEGKFPFTIVGGRQEGYKGYSYNSKLAAGKWRVYVETKRGQVLGRVLFSIEDAANPVGLVEVVR